MSDVNVEILGLLPLHRQLQVLQLAPQQRKRLMARVAKAVIRDSKKRVQGQRDLNGTPYPARYKVRSTGRRKMLSRLVKGLKVTHADNDSATVGFYSPVAGRIAADQQYGTQTQITAASFGGRSAASYNLPATRRQASALIGLGFKIARANGNGRQRPSIKYITEHYSQGQARSTLKRLREWAGQPTRSSWTTTLPARSFLGATATEVRDHITNIYDDIQQEIARHGTR